jgi:hypothetical protein
MFVLLQLNHIANHPQFELIQTFLPAALELPHPLAIPSRIRQIHNELHQSVSIGNATLPPLTLYFLGFVAGRTEMIHNFEQGFGKPFCRNVSSIIELKGKKYLESPPSAPHMSSSPSQ